MKNSMHYSFYNFALKSQELQTQKDELLLKVFLLKWEWQHFKISDRQELLQKANEIHCI